MREEAGRDSATDSTSPAPGFHWPLYIFEGAELSLFMISACVFSVILFAASSPVRSQLPDPVLRRLLMGASMGVTAILIIHSSMGKRSIRTADLVRSKFTDTRRFPPGQ